MVKLILTDIDGTLVTDDKVLLEENKQAIKQALDRGVHVTLVTGRHFSYAKPVIQGLGLDVPVVLQNGAFIYKPLSEEIIRQVYLSQSIASHLVKESRKRNLFYFVSSDFIKENDMLVDKDYVGPYEVYLKRNGYRVNRVPDVLQVLPQDVVEVAFFGPEEKVLDVLDAVDNLYKEASVVKSLLKEAGPFYEVYGPNVGKEQSLSFLCDYFHVTPDEVMYIGDAYNDVDIMSKVGYPVAMENAVREAKRIARLVTKTNNQAGVAWAINELVLKEHP
ncbi:Cof-type HAD-IIB family hydrolase [Coprothermobacter platensis]|uniref:Cof-type HAD-IIB family hydrolase n=1 Tax=Coprothermobacter platensis TaxID=108819 RepID=UPI00037D2874|nr:Cof-type HAD-IIB family hydrolase [Coprothermobacter platensis]